MLKKYECIIHHNSYEQPFGIWELVSDTKASLKFKVIEGSKYKPLQSIISELTTLGCKNREIHCKKDNNCRHTIRFYEDDFIIYPNMNGTPFYFKLKP